MPLPPQLSSLWRNLLNKSQVEQELKEEVDAYAITAILLAGVALSAMLFPARRVARVDPMTVLRDE